MTPNDIEVLLHYHTCSKPHPQWNESAVQYAVSNFIQAGMLTHDESADPPTLTTTDRGKALVRLLCNTPWPVQRWVDPRDGEEIKP